MSEPESVPTDSRDAFSDERPLMRRILLQYAIGAVFLLLIALFWYASSILLLIFSAVLIAVLLSSAAAGIARWFHLPRGVALGIVLLLTILIIGGGIWWLAPRMSEQATQLVSALPDAVERLREFMGRVLPAGVVESLPGIEAAMPGVRTLLERAGSVFSGVFGVFANLVIVLFLSIYLAAQPYLYVNGLVTLFPKRRRSRMREVLHKVGDTLGRWLLGKLLTMLIVGVLTATALLLLDVPLALVLGVVAGLFEFIPYLGPILAGIPAVLIGFSQSPTLAFYVFLLFVAIQIAESYLLQPLIALRMVSLPPAVTISMQVLLALPFGLLGIALATPLAAVIGVLVAMLYVQDVLDDPVAPPGSD